MVIYFSGTKAVSGLNGDISQKTIVFITTGVRTSNPI
jgi:hypothetical protein